MFKKFVERILKEKSLEDAMQNVFYGANGVGAAYIKDKISWKEHEMLLELINRLFK